MATSIERNDTIVPCKQRYPCIPKPMVLEVARMQNHRLVLPPWIGEIVVFVVHVQRGIYAGAIRACLLTAMRYRDDATAIVRPSRWR